MESGFESQREGGVWPRAGLAGEEREERVGKGDSSLGVLRYQESLRTCWDMADGLRTVSGYSFVVWYILKGLRTAPLTWGRKANVTF